MLSIDQWYVRLLPIAMGTLTRSGPYICEKTGMHTIYRALDGPWSRIDNIESSDQVEMLGTGRDVLTVQ